MSYLSELHGNVKDFGDKNQDLVKISIYKKVGEVITDKDGNYSNVQYDESENYVVRFEKDGFLTVYDNYPLNGKLNVVLPKADQSYPDSPNLFRAQDFLTGDSIMLIWGDSDFEYVSGYNIYRSTDLKDKFERVNVDIITEKSFLDTGVIPGVDYFYILEVISANSHNYFQGVSSRTAIVGPVNIIPSQVGQDLSSFAKVRIDSTKTNREGEKVFDGNPNTWWESTRGMGAWIEVCFDEEKYINKFYFRKKSVSRGITFATLQYWDGNKYINIEDVNYLRDMDYTFEKFLIKTNKVRLYVNKVEPLTETEITEIRVYGF